MAEKLYNLSVQERDVCPRCKQFKDTVTHDCRTILTALGEYRDLSISEPAPLAPDLPRPQIPLGRPGKRVHGFMSMREPLVDDWVPHHDDPDRSTTSATSAGETSFSHIPSSTQDDFPGCGSSFISPPQFTNIDSAGPSSYIPHVGQSSSYDADPSFFGTPPQHLSHPYGSMTALLTDPFTFGVEYSGHTFEFGGSSHVQEETFNTPHQPIPQAQSPMWDLNSPPTTIQNAPQEEHGDDCDDDDDDEEEEPQLVLRRPQRIRRRPRCGTGSHYFDE